MTYLKPFETKLVEKCIYNNDIVKSLEEISKHYFEFAKIEPGFFRFWMTIRLSPPQSIPYQSLRPYAQAQHHIVSNFFAIAAKQHGNLKEKNDMLAISFIGLLFIYATDALQNNQIVEGNIVYQIVHQFMYGIFS